MIRALLLARLVDGGHVPGHRVADPQLCRLARLAELLRTTATRQDAGPGPVRPVPPGGRMPRPARSALRQRLHEQPRR